MKEKIRILNSELKEAKNKHDSLIPLYEDQKRKFDKLSNEFSKLQDNIDQINLQATEYKSKYDTLYAQEKEKFENLKRNNQLDIVQEKKIEENRIFIYDENVEIVKKAEIKTFKHDYIQKKYKIKNTVFPTRKTITKILGIQTQENNIQINQN